jgi:hypothetical protein
MPDGLCYKELMKIYWRRGEESIKWAQMAGARYRGEISDEELAEQERVADQAKIEADRALEWWEYMQVQVWRK